MTSVPDPARASEELVFEPWLGHEGLRTSLDFWRAVLAACELDPLCNSPEWVLAHAEAWTPSLSVFGWRVRDSTGEPAAFLAFRREPRRGRFALRRALLVADGTFDSDYIDLAIRPGLERAVLAGALAELARMRGIEAVVVSGVLASSPTLRALRELLGERRLPARERPIECASAPLERTFDAYVATLPKRMRSKVRQAIRVAEEQGASFVWCHDPAELDTHLAGLFRLHAMRWQEAGQQGAFAGEERRRFYTDFARATLAGLAAPAPAHGGSAPPLPPSLRFSRLDVEGRPVAYQLGARAGERYYQMQEGFDTEAGESRVGIALRALSIRHLIAEGVRHYDFMEGPSRHKTDWSGKPRDCASLAFALPNARARVAYGARALLDRLRERKTTQFARTHSDLRPDTAGDDDAPDPID